MNRLAISIFLIALLLIAGCDSDDIREQKFVGVLKPEITRQLGEPDKVEEMTKRAEHIFGPIETIWSTMAMGDKIVTWTYNSTTGRKELYFVNDEPKVAGEFFWFHDQSKNPVF